MNQHSNGAILDYHAFFEPLLVARHWLVAYSGGLDSSVLLHMALKTLGRNDQNHSVPQLSAIHVDHQLMPEHQHWCDHCENVCKAYDIPLISETVSVRKDGQGIEQAARIARYQAFERHMSADTVLLMAHHANDQAETVVLRLMRGAGIRGAASIPRQRSLAGGTLHRPLLNLSRRQLFDYAKKHQLSYIEDASNRDTQFDRSFVRHEVLPVLAKRWPQAHRTLARFAHRSAEAEVLMRDLAQIDRPKIEAVDEWGAFLNLSALNELSAERRANVLRHWLAEKHHVDIRANQLEELLMLCQNAQAATHIKLQKTNDNIKSLIFECHVFSGRLYGFESVNIKTKDTENGKQQLWLDTLPANKKRENQRITWLEIGTIEVSAGIDSTSKNVLKAGSYCIATREPGAMARLNGQGKSLKKLMQELGIPPWLREIYPVVYAGDNVVAVGDKCVCDAYRAKAGEGWQLSISFN